MKTFVPILLLFIIACNNNAPLPKAIKGAPVFRQSATAIKNSTPYETIKAQANCKTYDTKYQYIVDSLLPYWYGTAWNFYGTTQVPQQGTIACGYFVTTILRDAHLPIQRVHLAQQTASKIIATTCNNNSIARFNKVTELEKYFTTKPNNTMYILGLDCHVGFVIKSNNVLYFIQSGYIQPAIVKKELLSKSAEILASKTYMIGAVKL
jgi:hypothetical protein